MLKNQLLTHKTVTVNRRYLIISIRKNRIPIKTSVIPITLIIHIVILHYRLILTTSLKSIFLSVLSCSIFPSFDIPTRRSIKCIRNLYSLFIFSHPVAYRFRLVRSSYWDVRRCVMVLTWNLSHSSAIIFILGIMLQI